MNILSAGNTDTGRKRTNNEDSFLVDDELRLYAVADGIGGHAGGEVASRLAVETFCQEVRSFFAGRPVDGGDPAVPSLAPVLSESMLSANAKLIETASRRPELLGMGTTLTALVFAGTVVHLAHIGDSRAYLLRDGTLKQISEDDTVVEEQRRAGLITPEQAKRSPYRHIITRALGIEADVSVTIREIEVREKDTFLLCSDGLTEMIEDREIQTFLTGLAPGAAVKKLVNAANERGGVDNITVVVITIEQLR